MPTFWEVPEIFREICRDLRSFSFITKTVYLIKLQNKGILVGTEQSRQSSLLAGSSYKGSEAKCPRAALQGRHFPGQTPCALLVKSPDCYPGNKEKRIFSLPFHLRGFASVLVFGFGWRFSIHSGLSFHTAWSFIYVIFLKLFLSPPHLQL